MSHNGFYSSSWFRRNNIFGDRDCVSHRGDQRDESTDVPGLQFHPGGSGFPPTGHMFQRSYTEQPYTPHPRFRPGGMLVAPLEQLFASEIEFYRKLRAEAPGTVDATALHTSFALLSGYEPLLRRIGRVTAQDVERLAERFLLSSDPRDVVAARDSLKRLLGLG
jgi:hypothetical protein